MPGQHPQYGPDAYYQTQPAVMQQLAQGGRVFGGGTVMMVAVPAPATKKLLTPSQILLGLGSLVSFGYLAWKARR